jgi:hypothetical protein
MSMSYTSSPSLLLHRCVVGLLLQANIKKMWTCAAFQFHLFRLVFLFVSYFVITLGWHSLPVAMAVKSGTGPNFLIYQIIHIFRNIKALIPRKSNCKYTKRNKIKPDRIDGFRESLTYVHSRTTDNSKWK